MGQVVRRYGEGAPTRRVGGTVPLRTVYARLRALWPRGRKESELDDEIQFHLSEEADKRVAAGRCRRRHDARRGRTSATSLGFARRRVRRGD